MATQLAHSTHFTEKKLVPHMIGKETVMIYPSLTPDMSLAERAHAFNVNKNALSNLFLPQRITLRALGDTLGCSAVVSLTAAKFKKIADAQLYSNVIPSATSYHGSNGHVIKDAVDISNKNTLKSVDDNMSDSNLIRPDGIQYARLQSLLNFQDVDSNRTTNYKFTWFHLLPTKSKTVKVDQDNNVKLYQTFTGPSDWYKSKKSERYWNHPSAINKPFDLIASSINDPNFDAELNITSAEGRLETLIHNAASDMIRKAIFDTICPNYIDDPASAVLKIKQVVPDPVDSSKTITLTVQSYHTKILQLMDQLGSDKDFPVDIVSHYFQNLAPKIKDQVKLNGYDGDTKTHSRSPFDQFVALNDLFSRAATAEYTINRQTDEIKEVLNTHHSFLTIPSVNLSTAEKSIKSYKEPSGQTCWGCGGSHSWYDSTTKKIACPKGNDPAVQAHAAKMFKEFKQRKRDRYASRKKKKFENMLTDLFSDDSDKDENNLKAQFKAFLSTKSESPKKAKFNPSKNLNLLFECLNITSDAKPRLEIPVSRALPHFGFHIGSPDGGFHPQLQPAYDTCAALNCGFLSYHVAIAKAYPELVKSITWAGDNFTPIILKGVVSNKNESADVTTSLTAVIEYFTPYVTSDGSQTTLKVALGHDISTNLIIGMSTIKAAKLQFDPSDDVITSEMLENFAPTPVIYKNTCKGLPNKIARDNDSKQMTLHCKTIIENACLIETLADKKEPVMTNDQSNKNNDIDIVAVELTTTVDTKIVDRDSNTDPTADTKTVTFNPIDDSTVTGYFG